MQHSDDRTQRGNTSTSLEGKSRNHVVIKYVVIMLMYYYSGTFGPIYFYNNWRCVVNRLANYAFLHFFAGGPAL